MGRRRKGGTPVHGWVVLDKPEGMSSARAVGRVRALLDAQKAGHAGTLDPLATGILPIALGEATKTVPYIQNASKRYECVIRWGQSTATDDREGDIVATSGHIPGRAEIERVLVRFVGEIIQIPPRFSAVKVDGERAYDLARAGEQPDLAGRPVMVYSLALLDEAPPGFARFDIHCGKGFYVRALARDLARALGTEGHIHELRRTQVGAFSEKDAISLEKLEDLSHSGASLGCLQPVERGLDDIPALEITRTEAMRLKQGRSISLMRTHVNQIGGHNIAYAACGSRPVAVGEIRTGQFHPTRVFNFPVKGTYDVDYD